MSVSNAHSGYIELNQVSQSFESQGRQITLFSHVDLTVHTTCSYAITGPSGSGKSSLLTLMSGLAPPSTGSCLYHGSHGIQALSEIRHKVGFIFQQFHLLPELTALHNVALPLKLRGLRHATKRAGEWLERVGLGDRLSHKPAQLSGGEQQRVAIARALVFEPEFIFADEPTGNLDSASAKEVADILFACCQERGAALVMVTHSESLAAQAQQVLAFNKGNLHWASQECTATEQSTAQDQAEAARAVHYA
ncbi:ABC transporter ATP-binding protein [Planctobacterium marinum]|uniref:ABC transporter ATP-binding protein n=1 Tax=Planctobacterium marinum TaxID=1631968 RepID=UPI001E4C9A10|nr:ABC transporter ATP-binding protein [Planctobacterium marinum]MCC2605683.1 ABC transporter ATP-binding protein [Planctobacterium marinum]